MAPKFHKTQDVGRLRSQGPQEGPPRAQGYLDPTRLTLKPFRARVEVQNRVLDLIEDNTLTFLVGCAGTGKTFLAAYAALDALVAGVVTKVIVARPAIEAGDPIGFLPGSLSDKVGPYVRPVLDSLAYFLGGDHVVKSLIDQGTLEITSMSFLRGRSFNDTFIVLDEMQNATPAQMKLALTRTGENSKVVVTLDPTQCDLDLRTHETAAADLERFRNRPDIGFHEFDFKDIVRSKLVKTVLQAYGS